MADRRGGRHEPAVDTRAGAGALGATAARSLLGRGVAVMSERGRCLARSDGRMVLVTLHPSALLRLPPEARQPAWTDWLDDLRHASSHFD